jgi:hypothetical protein
MASDFTLRARIAANTRWAFVTDRGAATAAARAAANARWDREVDPEGKLPPEERARRAASLRKAHFSRMALASAKKRRRR